LHTATSERRHARVLALLVLGLKEGTAQRPLVYAPHLNAPPTIAQLTGGSARGWGRPDDQQAPAKRNLEHRIRRAPMRALHSQLLRGRQRRPGRRLVQLLLIRGRALVVLMRLPHAGGVLGGRAGTDSGYRLGGVRLEKVVLTCSSWRLGCVRGGCSRGGWSNRRAAGTGRGDRSCIALAALPRSCSLLVLAPVAVVGRLAVNVRRRRRKLLLLLAVLVLPPVAVAGLLGRLLLQLPLMMALLLLALLLLALLLLALLLPHRSMLRSL
jgi:hypothetical protein